MLPSTLPLSHPSFVSERVVSQFEITLHHPACLFVLLREAAICIPYEILICLKCYVRNTVLGNIIEHSPYHLKVLL